ncbi:MAG: sodium-dependent bicarbonate transport family permease [Burkholderiales bacterium]
MINPSSLLIAPVMFFGLGFLAQSVRADLKLPGDLTRGLAIYLLAGIGLHGGAELAHAGAGSAAQAVAAALLLGFSLPLVGYWLLRKVCRLDRFNAAAIAAHYGSVSAGTFLTAIAYLQSREIAYESHVVIMLAIMETPAIVVALLLAQYARRETRAQAAAAQPAQRILVETLTHGSVVLLLGSMLIGAAITPKSLASITPFFQTIFAGALCLFLLEMGIDAARRMTEFRKVGAVLVAFGIAMPLIGGSAGLLIGHYWLGFSAGGTTLVALLGASASYIAVPPAVRMAIPEANPSFYLTLSLGITFPFNVVFGIPGFYAASQWITS